jgi:hypothetical protein
MLQKYSSLGKIAILLLHTHVFESAYVTNNEALQDNI